MIPRHAKAQKEAGLYYNFSNIRYGEVITGASRFKAPRFPTSRNSTVNDGQMTTRCPQTHPFWLSDGAKIATGVPASELQPPTFNISQIPPMNAEEAEDCLFLDVVVPRRIFSKMQGPRIRSDKESEHPAKGAPVLVWIDGGGFSAGYKHEQPPAGLVTRSQSEDRDGFIYVAMNYRAGLFCKLLS